MLASTFVGNTATSGATIWGGAISIAASILKGVIGVATCAGPVTSDGYNLSDEATDSCSLTATGDRVAAGSLTALGPLADNGGPTQTIMPLAGSPAAGVIPNDTTVQFNSQSTQLCPTTDQRSVASPPSAPCSTGSVQGQAPQITSASATTFMTGVSGSFTVTATGVPVPTFSSSGALPGGVSLDSETGDLTGTPQMSGSFPITITAANGNGPDAMQQFTLNVASSPLGPGGYWLAGADGGVFSYGAAPFAGSAADTRLNRPIVGIAATANHRGYWLVAADGGVFAFGNARFAGSIPGLGLAPAGSGGSGPHLAAPIVGIITSTSGNGYLLVAADGGVFAFGDARFAGSCPGLGRCSGTVVGIASDPTGTGYWIVTSTGHVYGFGDAATLGQPGLQSAPAVGVVRTPSGDGYWIVLANGAVYAYGDATYHGGDSGLGVANPAIAISATSDGSGYWITTRDGMVSPFGSALGDGGLVGHHLNGPIVAEAGF